MSVGKNSIAILAVLMLALSGANVASAASQTWYLESNGSLQAERGTFSGSDDEFVSVPDGTTATWYATESAEVPVQFGSGNFGWQLDMARACTGTWYVSVGYGNGQGDELESRFDSVMLSGCTAGINMGTIPVTTFTVPVGKFLGFEVHNVHNSGNSVTLKVKANQNGNSYFTSTTTDPGYPTPELGTLVLTGAGIVGIAGIVIARRNK